MPMLLHSWTLRATLVPWPEVDAPLPALTSRERAPGLYRPVASSEGSLDPTYQCPERQVWNPLGLRVCPSLILGAAGMSAQAFSNTPLFRSRFGASRDNVWAEATKWKQNVLI